MSSRRNIGKKEYKEMREASLGSSSYVNRRKKTVPKVEKKRLEDVFPKILERFPNAESFKAFARAGNGLSLSHYEVTSTMDDNKHSIEEGKLSLLWIWKQNNGADGTPEKINQLVYEYLKKKGKRRSGNFEETRINPDVIEDPQGSSGADDVVKKRCPLRVFTSHSCRSAVFFIAIGFLLASSSILLFSDVTTPRLLKTCPEISDPMDRLKNFFEEPECENYDKNIKKFITEVNKQTKAKASEFHIYDLQKPDPLIPPETVLVNFYNTPISPLEYKPQTGFSQQGPKQSGTSIDIEDFFEDMDDENTRHVTVVGGVGYGKTELLKKYALDVLNKSIPFLNDIEVVHFVNFRDLPAKDKFTPGELLFGSLNLTPDQIKCGVEFLAKKAEKVLLIMDGIDQYPRKLEKSVPSRNFRNPDNATSLLYNLLAGRLFPKLKILSSSREHAIRHFEGVARPDKVVALAGLSLQSMESLVQSFAGEEGPRIWTHLTTKSPTLLSVSSIPMFLVFSVSVLQRHKTHPPETVTEVLMLVLNDHISSNHVNDKTILSVISDLKAMAFKGTKEGRVTFTVTDLPPNRTLDDVDDLLIPLPGVKGRNQKLMEGHFRFFFCHQSLQEALTALHVAEMPLDEFENFIENHLHEPQWVVVRQLVYGLLLNERTHKIAKGNDPSVSLLNINDEFALNMKQEVLKESLEKQLGQLQGDGKLKIGLLELMHTMHECGSTVDDIIKSSMHEVNFLNLPLTPSDFYVLMWTIRRCPQLMLLNLINCKLTSKHLKMLVKAFQKSGCKTGVRVLLLGNYENSLPHDGADVIIDLIPFVSDLLWLGYRIEAADIELMQGSIDGKDHSDKGLTVVCWRRDIRRMVMLEHQKHNDLR